VSQRSVDAALAAGIADYGRRLRAREFNVEEATHACLERIREQNGRLQAFVHVAGESALATARELDARIARGADLGPLMGLPVAVKDLYSVAGMPLAAGSRVDVSDLVQPEGRFVGRLRAAGCVILGKTRTTEFALGGVNLTHPSAWNPCDLRVHRTAGGSSSGSAVALAAGMCAFAIGSDTGGSVRQPAALCGVAGYKASHGAWPVDGVFPMAPTLDSLGWFSLSARDAAIIHAALGGPVAPALPRVDTLRLAVPAGPFLAELDPAVAAGIERALGLLGTAGAEVVEVGIAQADELDAFAPIIPFELVTHLSPRRIAASKHLFDPVALSRVDGVELDAARYLDLRRRLERLHRQVDAQLAGFDAWLMPTTPDVATPVSQLQTLAQAQAWNRRAYRNTRAANLLDRCAISIPLPQAAGSLPVGLQVCCRHGEDARLLALATAIEQVLRGGDSRRP